MVSQTLIFTICWCPFQLQSGPAGVKLFHLSFSFSLSDYKVRIAKQMFYPFMNKTFNTQLISLRDATQKKIRDFLGIFPKGGGGVFSIPKTFAN